MPAIPSSEDRNIFTGLPLAGGSNGVIFNPATMEFFSSHSNGTITVVRERNPTSFDVGQNPPTMMGARTLTLDRQTNHIWTMSVEHCRPSFMSQGNQYLQDPEMQGVICGDR